MSRVMLRVIQRRNDLITLGAAATRIVDSLIGVSLGINLRAVQLA